MKRSTKRVVACTFLAIFLVSVLALAFAAIGNNKQAVTETTTTQTVSPPFTTAAQTLKITAEQVASWQGVRVIFVDPGAKLHVFKNVLEFPTSTLYPKLQPDIVLINYIDPNGVVYEGLSVSKEKVEVRIMESHVGVPTVSLVPPAKNHVGNPDAELDQYFEKIYIDHEPA